ncbi:MAG: hypothetical protein JWR87_3106 [Segetibacter sp.]|jgi:hypothetical protein|nr:hypothetical protein [Segetibacter sp.]
MDTDDFIIKNREAVKFSPEGFFFHFKAITKQAIKDLLEYGPLKLSAI